MLHVEAGGQSKKGATRVIGLGRKRDNHAFPVASASASSSASADAPYDERGGESAVARATEQSIRTAVCNVDDVLSSLI